MTKPTIIALALAALALAACAPTPSIVDSAKQTYANGQVLLPGNPSYGDLGGPATSLHNGQVLLPGNPSFGDLGIAVSLQCPEQDPAQPNCRVPK